MNTASIIRRPLVTEKSVTKTSKNSRYVFEVDRRANKYQIKTAIEDQFKVRVVAISTSVCKGKTRRQLKSRAANIVAPIKKAFLTLDQNQTIADLEVKE